MAVPTTSETRASPRWFRRRRGAVASRRSDQCEYRGRRPLLRVEPFLRAAEDGDYGEDLDAVQLLGPPPPVALVATTPPPCS